MATSGRTAWEKYFKGREDIETTLKEGTPLLDQETGKSKIVDLPANTPIVYLKTSQYDSKALVVATSNRKKIKGRVKFDAIAKPGIKSSSAQAKFKPSDIVPSIVNTWLTTDQIASNVTTYVKKFGLSKDVESSILYLINETKTSGLYTVAFDASKKDLVPSEFFEVLSAIKLSILLKKNDPKIRKVLGIPKGMDLSKSKIKIYIPQLANFPLIDYYISVTASETKYEESSLKISVKSKVKSSKANTIKFKDVFDNTRDVTTWYNGLNTTLKTKQKGPKDVAESAMEVYGSYTGKSLFGVPIKAINTLIKDEKTAIKNVTLNLFGSKFNFALFEKVIKKADLSLATLTSKTNLSTLVEQKLFDDVSKLIFENMRSKGAKPVIANIGALAYLCEKILMAASKENSYTKHNYYQMFFDKVLTQKEIAYAVSSMKGNTLQYEFFSLVNFAQEYFSWRSAWLSLRSKNQPTELSDVIGIDV